ncbi:MAG: TPM domain-containing protein [Pseudomonadota bacterium]
MSGAWAQASASGFAPIPPLTAHVTDTVGMLQPSQRSALENVLADYEKRSGSQIGILLVGSTAPEVIEQYSIRVADAWKIGRKGVDDGVLLIVAKDNPKDLRRLRIEAGRGVQGTVTDAQSKRILQDVIAPHFRQNDFYGGLAAGVAALTALLDQEHFPAPKVAPKAEEDDFSLITSLPFLFFFALIAIARMRSGRGRGNALSRSGWGRTAGVILGAGLGNSIGSGRGGFGGGSGGSFGGGFSGGGGGFDGGGASGDW